MVLLTLLEAELAYGLHPLLDRAGLTVLEGERIGLIGRNGTGKSSLLTVIAGLAALDDGELKRQDGLRVVLVEQEPELPLASSLRESLAIRGELNHIHDERERWRLEARIDHHRLHVGRLHAVRKRPGEKRHSHRTAADAAAVSVRMPAASCAGCPYRESARLGSALWRNGTQ